MPDLVYFRDGHGQIRSVRAAASSGPASIMDFRSHLGASTIEFKAKMTVRRDEEFLLGMLRHMVWKMTTSGEAKG